MYGDIEGVTAIISFTRNAHITDGMLIWRLDGPGSGLLWWRSSLNTYRITVSFEITDGE